MTTPTLLLTGATGFLGQYVIEEARLHFTVIAGTRRTDEDRLPPDLQTAYLPLDQPDALSARIAALAPQAILHLGALSRPNDCAQQPDRSYRVNVAATQALAQTAATLGIPFLFTSSSQVFDGKAAPYGESDPVRPLSVYARHKVAAERVALAAHPSAIIARMPLMYGFRAPHNFLSEWLHKLRNGQPLSVFTDEYRVPLSGPEAAQALVALLRCPDAAGQTLHIGGTERLSRADFADLMVEAFDIAAPNIRRCQQADMPMAAARPQDLTLDLRKVRQLIDFQPLPVRQALAALRHEAPAHA